MILTATLAIVLCLGAAQDFGVVREVVFEGETRLSEETLSTQLGTKVGAPFSWEQADLLLRTITLT